MTSRVVGEGAACVSARVTSQGPQFTLEMSAMERVCYSDGVALGSRFRYLSTKSRMTLLMVVPSSAALFLKAV
jgi:hypothetical protein